MINSDKIYFEEFRKGDKNAYGKIFHKYYAPLRSFALKYLLDKDACEDIVQEVMISVWQKKSEFKNLNTFKSYLYSSVKNKALNIIKHSKVKEKYQDEIKFLESEEYFTDNLIEEEVRAILFECYNSLPKQCHKIFKLSYFEGLRLKEIARELNISVNTVKTQKYRALKIIKENFKRFNKTIINLLMVQLPPSN
jgi:RNA polymerase sigma-70 factor (ECF subfamily)